MTSHPASSDPPRPPAGAPAPSRSRLLPVALLVTSLAALLAAGPLQGQELDARLDRLEARLDRAGRGELPYLAPRLYRAARERLARARERRARGSPQSRVMEAVERARSTLARADSVAASGRYALAEGLDARSAALEAGADTLAGEGWPEAEERLREAGRKLENGDPEGARRIAADAAERYRAAHLRALRRSVLGEARLARDTARAREAGSDAPLTLAEAEGYLARADSALQREGRDLELARTLADSARGAFLRAVRLAVLADSARQREGAAERILRAYEEELRRIGRAADTTPPADRGPAATARRIEAALRGRQEERDELERRLAVLRDSLTALAGRVDSSRRALAAAERRLDSLTTERARRRRRETRMREVRALFSPEEGRVRVSEDSVVLELSGVTFPAGEAEVTPESRAVLVKVESALRTFPGARVTIQGHTDARGDEERNRILSRERAIAVREHLLRRLPISADRVSAVGLGETRPVATNDTEEGRARNRRIDVVLELPPLEETAEPEGG